MRRRPLHRLNLFVTSPEVRLVGDNVEPKIYTNREAQSIAHEQGLDLVEISPTAKPPVCRIIDYHKFLYDEKKKAKQNKTHQTELKEIRFSPSTDDNDFNTKVKHATKFLQNGDKVKAQLQFKGRAILFKERGELVLLKFADSLKDFSIPEILPKLEGKRMHIILAPKKKTK